MFNFLSNFKFRKDEDYEAILAELDSKIQAKEVYLAELQVQRGNLTNNAFVYLFGAYLAYVPTYLFVLRSEHDAWDGVLLKAGPLFLMPVFLYFLRHFIQYLFRRKIASHEEILKALKTKQKLKVEELKNKSAYYHTKNLIDRYSGESRGPPGNKTLRPSKSSSLLQQPGRSSRPPHSDKTSDRPPQTQPYPQNRGGQPPNGRDPSLHPISLTAPPIAAGPPNSPPDATHRPWYDKIVDAIVGDEPSPAIPQFALICQHCFGHNGLVSALEYETVQYTCPKCKQFNPSRRSTRRRSLEPSPRPKQVPQTDMTRSSTLTPKKLPPASPREASPILAVSPSGPAPMFSPPSPPNEATSPAPPDSPTSPVTSDGETPP